MKCRAAKPLATAALVLALQLGTRNSAHAASRVIEVTPQDIAVLEINIRVEAEPRDETIGFDVFVSAGTSALSPRREGRLEIAPEVSGSPRLDQSQSRLQPMLWCSVREVSQDGVLQYSFRLPRQWLSRATSREQSWCACSSAKTDS